MKEVRGQGPGPPEVNLLGVPGPVSARSVAGRWEGGCVVWLAASGCASPLPIPSHIWLRGAGPPASTSQGWMARLASLSLPALLCSIQVTDATMARVQHDGCTMSLSAPPVRSLLSVSQVFWVLLLPPSTSLPASNGHPALAMVACCTLRSDKSPLALSSLPRGASWQRWGARHLSLWHPSAS